MTTIRNTILLIWCLIYSACVTSCMTETTRTITTDKSGTVTDTTITRKGSDPAALKLVSVAAEIYLPRRPIVIHQEKADHDIRRLLRGWRGSAAVAATGPVTAEEIRRRWKPASVDTGAGE